MVVPMVEILVVAMEGGRDGRKVQLQEHEQPPPQQQQQQPTTTKLMKRRQLLASGPRPYATVRWMHKCRGHSKASRRVLRRRRAGGKSRSRNSRGRRIAMATTAGTTRMSLSWWTATRRCGWTRRS